jgi:transcription antitermination protein NusB
MAIPQQKFREIVFQLLYSKDISQSSGDEIAFLVMKELSVTRKTVKEAQQKVDKILENRSEIDQLISSTSTSYRFERIQSIERNVLRLGVYELLFDDTIPPKVAIAEAIRLSKKFGTPESATFVNALLDGIFKSSIGETPDQENIRKTAEKLQESEKIALEASQQEVKPDTTETQ